jgi:ADP-heptose:LPS heptosyltransferase
MIANLLIMHQTRSAMRSAKPSPTNAERVAACRNYSAHLSSGGKGLLFPWSMTMVYPCHGEILMVWFMNLRKDMALLKLREQRFSMVMIFTSLSESPWPSAYACYLAGIPHRVGFADNVNGSALSHFLLPPADDFHQVDRNLNLLEAIGMYEANNQMELSISEEIEKRENELLSENGIQHGTSYIVLAPEASLPDDRYNPYYFAAAARILSAQTELQMLIVGSSDELEAVQPVLQVVDENLYGNVHSLVGKTTLPELAALIRGARLTITNKSAAMHIADVFQRPMVVLYPGTNATSSWNPRSTSARLLSGPASCSLCYESDCRFVLKCLEIRPEEVAIAALEMLGETAYSSTSYHVLQEYRARCELKSLVIAKAL